MLGLLVAMAVAQSVLFVLLVCALATNRWLSRRRRRATQYAVDHISTPLKEWLVRGGAPTALLTALRELPMRDAADVILRVTATRIPPEQTAELAAAMRREAWVERGLGQARSWFWWRRLDAARLLGTVGIATDRETLQRLLRDRHEAVQVVAGTALAALGDSVTVLEVLDALPGRSRFVQRQQFDQLKPRWREVAPLLIPRLQTETVTDRLLVWIAIADAVGTPDLLDALCELRGHPDVGVRLGVARALRNYFHPAGAAVLRTLLADADAAVRARAAQSLGAVGATDSVEALASGLTDAAWAVRFRGAIALAQLGESGRAQLRALRGSDDRFAREMATLVSGLSVGALDELAEA
jgi:HEAT repeat protein